MQVVPLNPAQECVEARDLVQQFGAIALQIAAIPQRIWAWWRSELSELLPGHWRNYLASRVEVRIRHEFADVEIVSPWGPSLKGRICRSGHVEPARFEDLLRRHAKMSTVWLTPPAHAVLSATISVPRSAFASFGKLLTVEADRWTPYTFAEILPAWAPMSAEGATLNVELRYVPRACLAEWSQCLARLGFAPSHVVLGSSREFCARLVRSEATSRSRIPRTVAIGMLAVAAVTLVASDRAALHHELLAWQEKLASEQAAYAQQRSIETQIGGLRALAANGAKASYSNSRMTFLTALATVIPPSDWLTEVAIRKEVVALRGYSVEPHQLVKSLEQFAKNGEMAVQGELSFDAKLGRRLFAVSFPMRENGP